MMMNSTSKSQSRLGPGTVIKGKWHHNHYRILKELGSGANGVVYLAELGAKKVALKISDSISVTSEVNVLKSFAKVQDSLLGPSLIDVDDWVRLKDTVPFYVMEYIEGPSLFPFIQRNGRSWGNVLILQLLKDLQVLHENGWVFGDLKPENLIVTGPPSRIRCIDVGGTTIKGRAIKEFTEFYDRGYWGLGTRRAEPAYDLFAVAMIMIYMEYPQRFSKKEGGIKQLQMMIRQKPYLQKIEGILLKALQGQYQTAREMRSELLGAINGVPKTSPNRQKQPGAVKKTAAHVKVSRQAYRKKKRRGERLETSVILLIISLLYILYIFGQMA